LRPAVPLPASADERQATGRERHDQKITVYLSATELLDLEHARLRLRRFGFVLDRGRLVREAIAILLADLDARGKDSLIARRIKASQEANGSEDAGAGQEAIVREARIPGQAAGASQPASPDKDEDTGFLENTVPSLRTPFFFDVPEVKYCAGRAKKKEVLWARPACKAT
jgi:hypothetical protein